MCRLTSKGADVDAATSALCEVGGQVTAAVREIKKLMWP